MGHARLIGLEIIFIISIHYFSETTAMFKMADSNQHGQAYYSKDLRLRGNVTSANRCMTMLLSLATDSEVGADIEILRRLSQNSSIDLYLYNFCYHDQFMVINILIRSPRYYILILSGGSKYMSKLRCYFDFLLLHRMELPRTRLTRTLLQVRILRFHSKSIQQSVVKYLDESFLSEEDAKLWLEAIEKTVDANLLVPFKFDDTKAASFGIIPSGKGEWTTEREATKERIKDSRYRYGLGWKELHRTGRRPSFLFASMFSRMVMI